MRALRLAKWVVIGVAALVVAAVAILRSTDFGAYKGEAEQAVQDATGRRLAIDGPVKLELLPSPSLVAEKVRFANAPWGSAPEMATVGRIEARVALWPLLDGQIVIKRLVVASPDILIETDKTGHGNWVMGREAPPAAPASSSGAPRLPVLNDVTVTNARIVYRDGRTGASNTLVLDRLHLASAGADAPLNVALAGTADAKPFAVSARLSRAGERWTVANLAATYGGTRLTGGATVDPAVAPLRVFARLDSPEIDVAKLAPSAPAAKAGPGAGDGRVIPDAKLPLDALAGIDADVTLTAARVVAGKIALERATIGATISGGKLTIRPLSATLAGGTIDGTATLDGSGALVAHVAAKDVDTGAIVAAAGAKGALVATAAFDARLKGKGRTVRALAASLDGTVGLILGKGTIGSSYVNLLGADVVRTLLPGGGSGGGTALECFAAPFTVAKGIAKTDGILFDTDRMTVRGGGTVSLRDETLDLLLKPESKDAALVSLATPIRVSGTLARPTAYPDPAAVAKDVAGAVAGAALGPLGLLLPLVSGGSGNDNPCLAALHRGGKAAAPPPPKKPDSGPLGVVHDLGNGIENGIKGLFGR